MIKTSKHFFNKVINCGKDAAISRFIDEYRRCAAIIIDDIWKNGYYFFDKKLNKEYIFDVEHKHYDIPCYLDYNKFNLDTFLSARTLRCLSTQVAGAISASVAKQKKRLYILDKNKSEGKSKKFQKALIRRIKQNNPVKPKSHNLNPELNSINCDFQMTAEGSHFDGFLRLKSITTERGFEIKIPIIFHKKSNQFLNNKGIMKPSFLIGKKSVDIRWEHPDVPKKTEGRIVGGDQGKLTILSLSDGQTTPEMDIHKHTLSSIIDKLSRKRKGSKAFLRAQKHRKNFINWSIKQLNLGEIKEIRLEEIININFGKHVSRKMKHWTNTLIRDKVEDFCETNGVSFVLQSSTYRSQRCSDCGMVRKSNRKGKIYTCKNCGLEIDADFNAALNHELDLPDVPYNLRKLNLNRAGFFWKPTGFFDLSGQELTVPATDKKDIFI